MSNNNSPVDNSPIEQYMALALQPVMVGAQERADITRNLDHIAELAFAAKNVTEIELPVRLYTIPEGALQGFTDEIFDWDHVDMIHHFSGGGSVSTLYGFCLLP